ncbi:MAG: response regulator [Acidobacteriota bacterium]|jgi:twitching motility two-component system response regulator PilH
MPTKVLVVEDNKTEQQLLVSALEDKSYEVVTADDGEEALDRLRVERPDLVILDIVLPKKDGYQVCRQIRASDETRGVKVIMISSKTQDADRYWGLKQGADAYLKKPFDEQDLMGLVQKLT